MAANKLTKSVLANDAELYLPGISVDCVIISFHEGSLCILLNKFKEYTDWMLPGGFVFKDEHVDTAAIRVLSDRTGLENIYLKQFHCFGATDRTNPNEIKNVMLASGVHESEQKEHWFAKRFVSVGYFALVGYSNVQLIASDDEDIAWFALDKIPPLYSDHNSIIEKAILSIRSTLINVPIGYELLPEKFVMSSLRLIFEGILGRKLDRRNFQRKILFSGLIDKLDEVYKPRGQKATALFSFNKERYDLASKQGIFFME